ncbi:MAG: acyl-CoA carboxylase subunit epsilon [Pseudonocardiaceae bacterium]
MLCGPRITYAQRQTPDPAPQKAWEHPPLSGDTSPSSPPHSRVIHIVRGDPSDEEVAALTTVIVSLGSRRSARIRSPETGQRSAWAHPLHASLHPGPGAWRTSALPR